MSLCVCVEGGRRAVEDSCCQGAKDRLGLTPVCWITLSSVWCRKDKEQTLKNFYINPALRLLLTSLPALSDNINRDRNWGSAFKLRWEKWGVCWAARGINRKGKKPTTGCFSLIYCTKSIDKTFSDVTTSLGEVENSKKVHNNPKALIQFWQGRAKVSDDRSLINIFF